MALTTVLRTNVLHCDVENYYQRPSIGIPSSKWQWCVSPLDRQIIRTVPNKGLTAFGRTRKVVPIVRRNTKTNSFANKQIYVFAYFDKHYAVSLITLLYSQMI